MAADETPLSPNPIIQLATGFAVAKTLSAAVELDLFTKLSGTRGRTKAEVAEQLDLAERPADALLAACASLGLLEKADGRYRNSALAEAFLVAHSPQYLGGLIRYLDRHGYAAWSRVTEALRGNRPVGFDADEQRSLFEGDDPTVLTMFWNALHAYALITATALAGVYDLGRFNRLLDVGGGSGAFPIVLCERHPGLEATVYDLPHVTPVAEAKVAEAGLAGRVGTMTGDFLEQPLPAGYDLILLSQVLHDWDEATDRDLLAKCHAALPSGGGVVICELMLNPERTGPAPAAIMGMSMLVDTAGGRNYSEVDYTAWLTDAGFTDVDIVRFDAPGANGAVVARKP
jgi:SAM-dependent methyltransferase